MADWYMAWASDHCQKFGFRDQDSLMVLAWRDAFSMLFTADELKAATGRLLISEDAPRFASDHRGAIIRAVTNNRLNAGRKATSSSLVAGCIECGGNGIVVVPHPGITDEYPPRMKPVLPMPRADPTGLTRVMGVCCVRCEVACGHGRQLSNTGDRWRRSASTSTDTRTGVKCRPSGCESSTPAGRHRRRRTWPSWSGL